MASDITTGAEFTTLNMKPANSEVASSVWGRNISDNTGFLRESMENMPVHIGTADTWLGETNDQGLPTTEVPVFSSWFVRSQNHNTIVGTINGTAHSNSISSPNGGTFTFSYEGDLGTYTFEDGTNDSSKAIQIATTYNLSFTSSDYASPNSWARFKLSGWVSNNAGDGFLRASETRFASKQTY
jgi:hypothetical protein